MKKKVIYYNFRFLQYTPGLFIGEDLEFDFRASGFAPGVETDLVFDDFSFFLE